MLKLYIRDFDRRLHADLSTDLYSFIPNVKLGEGGNSHDAVDMIFDKEGAVGSRKFLDNLIIMMKEFHKEDAKIDSSNSIHNGTSEFILSKLTNLL